MNEPLSFARAVADFRDGTRTPREFLEQCLKTIAKRDRAIHAFVDSNAQEVETRADIGADAGRVLPYSRREHQCLEAAERGGHRGDGPRDAIGEDVKSKLRPRRVRSLELPDVP